MATILNLFPNQNQKIKQQRIKIEPTENIFGNLFITPQSLPVKKIPHPSIDITKKFEESLQKCQKPPKKLLDLIDKNDLIIINGKRYRKIHRERYKSDSSVVKVTKESNNRRASDLVNELLLDIYGRHVERPLRMPETDYGSMTSVRSYEGKTNENYKYNRLITKSVWELRHLLLAYQDRVKIINNNLVKYLKKKDALKMKQEKLCNIITANLQAHSCKRSEDTNMRFSPSPPLAGGDTGFTQWRDAMKMVARLPGGIPSDFRRKLWLALSEKHLQSRGVNWTKEEKICFNEWTNPDDSELGIQIVKDLHRTGCSLFCGAAGQENQALLKRVLLAYARWNKQVGYCQGFNMLAALILQVMDKNETDSLKVMIYLIEGVLPESYFANNLRGLSVDMVVFRDLLKMRLPHLSKHLELLQNDAREGNSYEPPLTNVFTMQWFLTLFCNCLPQSTVLRVWDLIFLEGNEILLRTAIAIWERLSDRILAVNSADEFYSIMGVLTREMLEFGLVDSNTLIKSIVSIGACSELNEMRDKYLYNITPWTQSVQTAAKKGFRLFYSDDDDNESDNDERVAVTTAYGMNLRRKKEKSPSGTNVIQPYTHGHPDRERLALDISALKKQYAKLRERQRQAHIILTAACARQPLNQNPSPSPIAMNHLLLGKNAIVNAHGRRLGPPKGSIPPSRTKSKSKHREEPETLHWKDAPKVRIARRTSIETEEKPTIEDDSSSYSEDDTSSTSTELCDEHDKVSDVEVDDKVGGVKKMERINEDVLDVPELEKDIEELDEDVKSLDKNVHRIEKLVELEDGGRKDDNSGYGSGIKKPGDLKQSTQFKDIHQLEMNIHEMREDIHQMEEDVVELKNQENNNLDNLINFEEGTNHILEDPEVKEDRLKILDDNYQKYIGELIEIGMQEPEKVEEVREKKTPEEQVQNSLNVDGQESVEIQVSNPEEFGMKTVENELKVQENKMKEENQDKNEELQTKRQESQIKGQKSESEETEKVQVEGRKSHKLRGEDETPKVEDQKGEDKQVDSSDKNIQTSGENLQKMELLSEEENVQIKTTEIFNKNFQVSNEKVEKTETKDLKTAAMKELEEFMSKNDEKTKPSDLGDSKEKVTPPCSIDITPEDTEWVETFESPERATVHEIEEIPKEIVEIPKEIIEEKKWEANFDESPTKLEMDLLQEFGKVISSSGKSIAEEISEVQGSLVDVKISEREKGNSIERIEGEKRESVKQTSKELEESPGRPSDGLVEDSSRKTEKEEAFLEISQPEDSSPKTSSSTKTESPVENLIDMETCQRKLDAERRRQEMEKILSANNFLIQSSPKKQIVSKPSTESPKKDLTKRQKEMEEILSANTILLSSPKKVVGEQKEDTEQKEVKEVDYKEFSKESIIEDTNSEDAQKDQKEPETFSPEESTPKEELIDFDQPKEEIHRSEVLEDLKDIDFGHPQISTTSPEATKESSTSELPKVSSIEFSFPESKSPESSKNLTEDSKKKETSLKLYDENLLIFDEIDTSNPTKSSFIEDTLSGLASFSSTPTPSILHDDHQSEPLKKDPEFEQFLEERVKKLKQSNSIDTISSPTLNEESLKTIDVFVSDFSEDQSLAESEDIYLQQDLLSIEERRFEAGRRNSERALRIIQENSAILHRILLHQSKSIEAEDTSNESTPKKTFIRSDSLPADIKERRKYVKSPQKSLDLILPIMEEDRIRIYEDDELIEVFTMNEIGVESLRKDEEIESSGREFSKVKMLESRENRKSSSDDNRQKEENEGNRKESIETSPKIGRSPEVQKQPEGSRADFTYMKENIREDPGRSGNDYGEIKPNSSTGDIKTSKRDEGSTQSSEDGIHRSREEVRRSGEEFHHFEEEIHRLEDGASRPTNIHQSGKDIVKEINRSVEDLHRSAKILPFKGEETPSLEELVRIGKEYALKENPELSRIDTERYSSSTYDKELSKSREFYPADKESSYISREVSREIYREECRGISIEEARGVSKDIPRGISRENSKGLSKEDTREPSRELPRGISREDSRGVSRDTTRDVFQQDYFSRNDTYGSRDRIPSKESREFYGSREFGSGERFSRDIEERSSSRELYGSRDRIFSGARRSSKEFYGSMESLSSKDIFGSREAMSREVFGSRDRLSRDLYGSRDRLSRDTYGSGDRLSSRDPFGSKERLSRDIYGSRERLSRDPFSSRISYGKEPEYFPKESRYTGESKVYRSGSFPIPESYDTDFKKDYLTKEELYASPRKFRRTNQDPKTTKLNRYSLNLEDLQKKYDSEIPLEDDLKKRTRNKYQDPTYRRSLNLEDLHKNDVKKTIPEFVVEDDRRETRSLERKYLMEKRFEPERTSRSLERKIDECEIDRKGRKQELEMKYDLFEKKCQDSRRFEMERRELLGIDGEEEKRKKSPDAKRLEALEKERKQLMWLEDVKRELLGMKDEFLGIKEVNTKLEEMSPLERRYEEYLRSRGEDNNQGEAKKETEEESKIDRTFENEIRELFYKEIIQNEVDASERNKRGDDGRLGDALRSPEVSSRTRQDGRRVEGSSRREGDASRCREESPKRLRDSSKRSEGPSRHLEDSRRSEDSSKRIKNDEIQRRVDDERKRRIQEEGRRTEDVLQSPIDKPYKYEEQLERRKRLDILPSPDYRKTDKLLKSPEELSPGEARASPQIDNNPKNSGHVPSYTKQDRTKLTINLKSTSATISPEISPQNNLSCLQFTSFQKDLPCTSKFSPICSKDKESPKSSEGKTFGINLPTLSPPRRSNRSPISPQKHFNPFPVQATTRQPKELGVKLGLYKDLSPIKSPSKW